MPNYRVTSPPFIDGEDYNQAVRRAGVVELPDDGKPTPPSTHLASLLSGRFEDDDPPGAPR